MHCLRITYLFLCVHSPHSVTAPKNGTDDVTWCNHVTTVLDPEATMHIDGTYHSIVVCPLTSFTSHIVFFSINYITDTQPAHHGNGRNSVHRLSYPSRLEPPCCQQQLAAAGVFWWWFFMNSSFFTLLHTTHVNFFQLISYRSTGKIAETQFTDWVRHSALDRHVANNIWQRPVCFEGKIFKTLHVLHHYTHHTSIFFN